MLSKQKYKIRTKRNKQITDCHIYLGRANFYRTSPNRLAIGIELGHTVSYQKLAPQIKLRLAAHYLNIHAHTQ